MQDRVPQFFFLRTQTSYQLSGTSGLGSSKILMSVIDALVYGSKVKKHCIDFTWD